MTTKSINYTIEQAALKERTSAAHRKAKALENRQLSQGYKYIRKGKTIILANHEIWRRCPKCNAYNDLRKSAYCEECGSKL